MTRVLLGRPPSLVVDLLGRHMAVPQEVVYFAAKNAAESCLPNLNVSSRIFGVLLTFLVIELCRANVSVARQGPDLFHFRPMLQGIGQGCFP